MALFDEVLHLVPALRDRVSEGASTSEMHAALACMPGDAVVQALREADAVVREAEQLRLLLTGVVASRSTREHGHRGVAQSQGHRSAQSLFQDMTGCTRAEAARSVRVGLALWENAGAEEEARRGEHFGGDPDDGGRGEGPNGGGVSGDPGLGGFGGFIGFDGLGEAEDAERGAHAGAAGSSGPEAGAESDAGGGAGAGHTEELGFGGEDPRPKPEPPLPWHAPLDRALRAGVISAAQHDAIRRGLGEPPVVDPTDPRAAGRSLEEISRAAAAGREAWSVAAQQLVEEAAQRSVEELARSARMIRDELDPEGAEARFRARYEARSYRMYRDRDGRLNAHIVFDDEGGAWTESAFDSFMRPRRGGVRFVDPDEKKRAEEIAADPRTNDQLAYDLFLDLVRAGTLAEAKAVFGTRRAGVRVVTVVGSDTAFLEETGTPVPATFAGLQACTAGTIGLTITENGDPLRLGRSERLFSPGQRLALAIRDGGCRWRGCDRPASYCEAHHIDPHSEGGCTDIERGILLCRFHHMNLHHGGWRITREGLGDFLLHPPGGGAPIVLKPRLALKYVWGGMAPPTPRLLHAA